MAKAAVMLMLEPAQIDALDECSTRESRTTSAMARLLIVEGLQRRKLLDQTGLVKQQPDSVEA